MTTQTDALVEDQRQLAIPVDTFRARLMLARLHAGDLTIREAAEKAGLNHASWANWERGMKPRDVLEVADQISEALGVDRHWLLYGGQLAAEIKRRDRHGRRADRTGEQSNRGSRDVPAALSGRPHPVSVRSRRDRPTTRGSAPPATQAVRRPVRIFTHATDGGL